MSTSLFFIPDISGFTKFVQTTEVAHSQHVIAELLEVLISANTQQLKLAEVEGDALFFYLENEVLSQERLLAQIETMFTAFHSHLKLLEKNRICPCNACASAPQLKLKLIAHCGELRYLSVQGIRKPFGEAVIAAHRLLKNSIESDNYALISKTLASTIELPIYYYSKVYRFREGEDTYDGTSMAYIYTVIDVDKLQLVSFPEGKKVHFEAPPNLIFTLQLPLSASRLLEYITNYSIRHLWVKGADRFEYNANEVTRLGSEHVCVVNGKHLNFVAVTKEVGADELVYGEMTSSSPAVDVLYQFFIVSPLAQERCVLRVETYWEAGSIFKKIMVALMAKRIFKKNIHTSLRDLLEMVRENRVASSGRPSTPPT